MTTNLFALTSTGNTRLKPVGRRRSSGQNYKLIMNDIAPTMTWFEDRPGRNAGTDTVNQLIHDWDAFGGVNPNSALTYVNSKGKADTIVFEQERPKYNEKKNRLVSLVKIHTDQELDDHRADNTSYLSGHAYNAKIGKNNKFSKKIDNASLFIDGMFAKWTSVDINNTSNGDIFIQRLISDRPDWENSVLGFTEVLASAVFAVGCTAGTAAAVGASIVSGGVAAAPSALAVGTCWAANAAFLYEGASRLIAGSDSAGYGPAGKDDTFVIKAGGKSNITDTDTVFGTTNGVADVPFLLNFVTENKDGDDVMLPLGLFTFDNPIIGKAKATFTAFAETVPDGVIINSDTTPKDIYGRESGENVDNTTIHLGNYDKDLGDGVNQIDRKFINKHMFKDLDVSVTYLGDNTTGGPNNLGSSDKVMGWELNISGEVPDVNEYIFDAI